MTDDGQGNYEKWATDLCTLMDEIEMALADEDMDRAEQLVAGRFNIGEQNGFRFVIEGQASGLTH